VNCGRNWVVPETNTDIGQFANALSTATLLTLVDRSKLIPSKDHCSLRWYGEVTVLQVIDVQRVLHAAESSNIVVEFRVRTGETIFHQGLLAVIEGPSDPRLQKVITASVTTGVERTFEQDATFVFRVLSHIALRALSPGINDPRRPSKLLTALKVSYVSW
jgi:uncharacterized membrane protein